MFQITTNSLEGKFFAETPEAAQQWGLYLQGKGNFRVVSITFPREILDELLRFGNLDATGNAYFADYSKLELLSKSALAIEEVTQ
jgi:hypothetical protein